MEPPLEISRRIVPQIRFNVALSFQGRLRKWDMSASNVIRPPGGDLSASAPTNSPPGCLLDGAAYLPRRLQQPPAEKDASIKKQPAETAGCFFMSASPYLSRGVRGPPLPAADEGGPSNRKKQGASRSAPSERGDYVSDRTPEVQSPAHRVALKQEKVHPYWCDPFLMSASPYLSRGLPPKYCRH